MQFNRLATFIVGIWAIIIFSFTLGIKPKIPPLLNFSSKKQPLYEQQRGSGSKDIWIVDGKERLHHHVRALSSQITMIPGSDHDEVVENMNQFEGFMEEKNNKVRYLKGDKGLYLYRYSQLQADEITFNLYKTILPTSCMKLKALRPIFSAKAHLANIDMKKPSYSIYAKDFEAIYQRDANEANHSN